MFLSFFPQNLIFLYYFPSARSYFSLLLSFLNILLFSLSFFPQNLTVLFLSLTSYFSLLPSLSGLLAFDEFHLA